jgi:HD-like signal output (HDOD) protein
MIVISKEVSVELIEDLQLFRDLTQEDLEAAAKACEIVESPGRSLLFKIGSEDQWVYFLLSGNLVLVDEKGKQQALIGTGDMGIVNQPLGWEQPYTHHGLAHTDIRLIRISRQTLTDLINHSRPPDLNVDMVDETSADTGTQIFFQLFNDLMSDKLKLPTMPDIAMRVREAIAKPNSNAQHVAKVIQTDPVLTAKIIQAANSAMYTGAAKVDNVSSAVVRLGLSNTREMVIALTLRDVFKSKSPLLNKRMVEVWMHSSMVASIASVLSKRIRGYLPDRALLAGLTHDIGVVPMLAHAEKYPDLIKDPNLLEQTLTTHKGQIGTMICRKWNFPDDLIEVPSNADDWLREQPGTADYADLIIISQLHSLQNSHTSGDYPSFAETPAFRRMRFLNPEDQMSPSNILNEARDEIASVQKMLIGG